jgi:O-methyltransferase
MKRFIRKGLNKLGYDIVRFVDKINLIGFPVEFSEDDAEILRSVINKNLSMASLPRLYATMAACKYVAENNIDGDFVECGVWRGGNAVIAARIFHRERVLKKIWLFDTFRGMTKPTERDIAFHSGISASAKYERSQQKDHNSWCYSSVGDVMKNLAESGVRSDTGDVRFIEGDVLATLSEPANLPSKIAILRLDTDWFESSLKELEVLYPLVARGGVVLLDDYGHWGGARAAVDTYFSNEQFKPLKIYNDRAGRSLIKL